MKSPKEEFFLSQIVSILPATALDQTFSYFAPKGEYFELGTLVRVSFRNRLITGVVWNRGHHHNVESLDANRDASASHPLKKTHLLENKPIDPKKLKPILEVYSHASLPPDMINFINWVSEYTLYPKGLYLKMVLQSEKIHKALQPVYGFRIDEAMYGQAIKHSPSKTLKNLSEKISLNTKTKKRTSDSNSLLLSRQEWASLLNVSPSSIDNLRKKKILIADSKKADFVGSMPDPTLLAISYNAHQKEALAILNEEIDKSKPLPILLEGVTGSGKTEVYFDLVAKTIAKGQQVLILVPEINLTSAILERFKMHFGCYPFEWHSALKDHQRHKIWNYVVCNQAKVVIGARSSLFLPFANLGLIIIDEEHDSSYKQMDGARYHARDMAVVRAHLGQFPVVLVSATPSLETLYNCENGRYKKANLPIRHHAVSMPENRIIDLTLHPPEKGKWISTTLIEAAREAFSHGEQVLFFLNRRGYAPLTLCRNCGHQFHCPNCSTWLVEHRQHRSLLCHHCGFKRSIPALCPDCRSPDHLVALGPGVERIEEEARELFPNQRILILSSDVQDNLDTLKKQLQAISEGKFDLIIGTQLVAKGHTFAKLNLVGILDADIGLSNADPKAIETSYQLLAQVSGRAGRIHGKGIGYIQTCYPNHPVMQALLTGDSHKLYQTEMASRQQAKFPPFGRLAAIILSSKDKNAAMTYGNQLVHSFLEMTKDTDLTHSVRILGPAEAPLSFLRGLYRFRLLVHAHKNFNLSQFMKQWRSTYSSLPRLARSASAKDKKVNKHTALQKSVTIHIDIDPISFL